MTDIEIKFAFNLKHRTTLLLLFSQLKQEINASKHTQKITQYFWSNDSEKPTRGKPIFKEYLISLKENYTLQRKIHLSRFSLKKTLLGSIEM